MLYELRTYRVHARKLEALLDRFRNHTCALFEKHGIKNIGYWVNSVGGRNDELIYLVAFEDSGQRDRAWAAFEADPEWQRAFAESEKDGYITDFIVNQSLEPTDFSPLR